MFTSLSDEQRHFVRDRPRSGAGRVPRPRARNTWTAPSRGKTCGSWPSWACSAWRCHEEYGGLGLPVFDTALVLEEIAKVCYVTAMAVLGEVGVQTRVISTYAPEAIKQRILPAVASGDCLLAICMTEPDAGTDVANYRTNVDRVGNRLRAQRGQDPDQPRRGGRHVRRLHPRRQEAGPRRHRLRPGRKGHAGVFGDRHLSHDGRREPARDPL